MVKFGFLITLIATFVGCAASPHLVYTPLPLEKVVTQYKLPNRPPTTLPITLTADQHVVYCYNADLIKCSTVVFSECSRRFVNPVVLGHGGDNEAHEWTMFADGDCGGRILMKELASQYSALFRDRDIIFWSCNAGHRRLDVGRVWYFDEIVWTVPDEALARWRGVQNIPQLTVNDAKYSREMVKGYGWQGDIWEVRTQGSSTDYDRMPTTRPAK